MYCVKCGQELEVGAVFVQDKGRPAHIICPKEMAYCEECGRATYMLCRHIREKMVVVTPNTQ